MDSRVSIRKMLRSYQNGDFRSAKKHFQTAMNTKAHVALEDRKVEVARGMFKKNKKKDK